MKFATMIIIQPDGSKLVSQHDPKKLPPLEVLQAAVGGLIQPCDQFLEGTGKRAYCNEEFLVHDFAPNPEGTRAVKWPAGEKDLLTGEVVGPLHGNIVLLEGFEDEDDEDEDDEG